MAKDKLSEMEGLKRTHYCGEVAVSDVGSDIVLMGWVNRRRDLGDLIFIDLRDRTGLIQIVTDARSSEKAFEAAQSARSSMSLQYAGKFGKLAGDGEHRDETGAVEVAATDIRILNTAKTPPFYIWDDAGPMKPFASGTGIWTFAAGAAPAGHGDLSPDNHGGKELSFEQGFLGHPDAHDDQEHAGRRRDTSCRQG